MSSSPQQQKKKQAKPPKSHTKNKKHQKHRGAGGKHFAITGQVSMPRRSYGPPRRVDQSSQSNEQHAPLESNLYRYSYSSSSSSDDDDGDNGDDELLNRFGVRDERTRHLHILLEDLGGASSYHRKPWEKEWDDINEQEQQKQQMDFELLNIETNELARSLKLLSVQQRLHLYTHNDEVILDPIMKVTSVPDSSTIRSSDDEEDEKNSDSFIVSRIPLTRWCHEQQEQSEMMIHTSELDDLVEDGDEEEDIVQESEDEEKEEADVEQQQQLQHQRQKDQQMSKFSSSPTNHDLSNQSDNGTNNQTISMSHQINKNDQVATTITTRPYDAQKEKPISIPVVSHDKNVEHNSISTRAPSAKELDDLNFLDDLIGETSNQTTTPSRSSGDQDKLAKLTTSYDNGKSAGPFSISKQQPPASKTHSTTLSKQEQKDDNLDEWLDSLI